MRLVDSAKLTDKNLLYREDYFRALRQLEYRRLDKNRHVYLDYTGAALYPESLIEDHFRDLQELVLGNPHSENPAAESSSERIRKAREKVLSFFNAKNYECVFTANASGALKLLGDCYPFDNESRLLLLADNHNSVNGLRQFCRGAGGSANYTGLDPETLEINEKELQRNLSFSKGLSNNLFAFPAQSNATGIKHSLDWVEHAKNAGWDVLLDVAAFAPGSKLDLEQISPDFVALSFYKMFGYPTGLGCLLVRKEKTAKLKKTWFAGGTVKLVSVQSPHHVLADGPERFEDGTVNFLDIPAIEKGLLFLENIGMEEISCRTTSLIAYLINQLSQISYSNGQPIVRIIGPQETKNRGSSLLLQFYNRNGKEIAFELVEQRANEAGISVRGGCFCNPGVDEIRNEISAEDIDQYFEQFPDGDYWQMMAFLKKSRGAIRISVGIATVQADLEKFLQFVCRFENSPAA